MFSTYQHIGTFLKLNEEYFVQIQIKTKTTGTFGIKLSVIRSKSIIEIADNILAII